MNKQSPVAPQLQPRFRHIELLNLLPFILHLDRMFLNPPMDRLVHQKMSHEINILNHSFNFYYESQYFFHKISFPQEA